MSANSKEKAPDAARHCLDEMPYRMIVFNKLDHNKVALYSIAGSADPPRRADKALRTAFAVHGGRCHYCKKAVTTTDFTIDHAEAVIFGGHSDIQNLLIACLRCNRAKGHQIIEVFHPDAGREWLAALLAQVQDRLNKLGR